MLAVPSLLVDMKARGGALGGFVGRGFEAASAYSRSAMPCCLSAVFLCDEPVADARACCGMYSIDQQAAQAPPPAAYDAGQTYTAGGGNTVV